jgi:hypothetical protein
MILTGTDPSVSIRFVKGHDFSRADKVNKINGL